MQSLTARAGLTACVVVCLGLQAGCDRPNVNYPEFVKDLLMMETIHSGLDDMWTEHLPDWPPGRVDVVDPCVSGSGSATITGLVVENDDQVSFELEFELDRCGFSLGKGATVVAVELSGSMEVIGSFNRSAELGAFRLRCAELQIVGSSKYSGHPGDWDKLCAFELTHLVTELSTSSQGHICDRPVSRSYSFTPEP